LRYLRHGEGLPLWPTFVEQLESSAAVRRAPADAIAGAHTAFGWFGANAATRSARVATEEIAWTKGLLRIRGRSSRLPAPGGPSALTGSFAG
jgi:hypothetical protein